MLGGTGAEVRRIDDGLGVMLDLPTAPTPLPGFAHISNIRDEKVVKLNKVRPNRV